MKLFQNLSDNNHISENMVKNTSLVNIFVARQPIYKASLDVFGFELLYRTEDTDSAKVKNGVQATSVVILNTFIEIGLNRLVGDKLAFINIDRSFLVSKHPLPFQTEHVVLDIVPPKTYDNDMAEAIRLIFNMGYQMAVDAHVVEKAPSLIDSISIIKVGISGKSAADLGIEMRYLRRYRKKMLAERVETVKDFEFCKLLGFDYFQGFFLAKPNIVQGKRLPARRLAILELLARLYDPEVDLGELENIIKLDVSLSYKLLRMVNSAYYGINQRVESIRHALALVGIKQLRSWLLLLSLSEIDDKPNILMTTAMIRGRMCELLMRSRGDAQVEKGFTVGLLSVLDAMMDMPMDQVLSLLPLSPEISETLLSFKGELGRILRCVIAYERGNWNEVDLPGLKLGHIRDSYLESIAWAAETNKIFSGG